MALAVNYAKPLLRHSAGVVQVSRRHIKSGSRITKFKKPFVGGIHKKLDKPLQPRSSEEYAAEGESLYPEIQGKYPPGEWGNMDPDRAWRFQARSNELMEIGSLRDRLYDLTKVKVRYEEKEVSKENMKHWFLEPSINRPYFFPFVQYVTKTRLHLTLPEEVLQANEKVDHVRLKRRINDKVRLLSAEGVPAETRVAAVVQEVSAELLAGGRLEHLVEGQLEENLTFEAAWRRGGFAEDDMENEIPKTKKWDPKKGWYAPVGGYDHLDPGIINFQGSASPFLTLRSQFPLKEVNTSSAIVETKSDALESASKLVETENEKSVDENVGLDSFVHDWIENDDNSLPLYAYHPSLYGLECSIAPPRLNAGFSLPPVSSRAFVEAHRDKFWVEKPQTWNAISDRCKMRRVIKHHTIDYHPGVESDPRGFPHTAFALPTSDDGIVTMGYEHGYGLRATGYEPGIDDPLQTQQWDAERMLTTLFTWNVASAHFQGFCSYLDLTYPIVSQGILTDGHSWQFYILKTDTIQVWRDDDAFSKGSEMWMSRKMNMVDDADLIVRILTNVLAKETRRDMTQSELQPFVTKSDEVAEIVRPKYDFEMKVL